MDSEWPLKLIALEDGCKLDRKVIGLYRDVYTMNNEIIMGQIKRALGGLSFEVSMSTSLNQLSINVHAEQFFVELLNDLFNYNLVNTNFEEQNAASIDLLDEGNRVAIQVTSDSSLNKVRQTLHKFCEKKLDEKVDRLIILNLIKKTKHKETTLGETDFKINLKEDVWDYTDLISEINNLEINKLIKMAIRNKVWNLQLVKVDIYMVSSVEISLYK